MAEPVLSDLVARVTAASRRPSTLGATPPGAVSLAMGEPFEGTHPRVVEAAVEALRAGATRYAPMTGAPALREALAARLTARHGRAVTAREVVLTHGASAGLAATVLALVGPGDRVVLPEPTYSLYADHVAMAGGTVTWVPDRPDGTLDLDRLADVLPGARMVVLCDPGNPTGRLRGRAELLALGRLVERSGCYLLSDEAYADVVFDGARPFSALEQPLPPELVVQVGTFSKSYAMTGWRLGHVVAHPRVADAVNLVHRTVDGPLNTAVQHAGTVALQLDDALLRRTVAAYQERRDLVVAGLADVAGVQLAVPQGAFYAFPRVDTARTSDELTALAAAAGVLVRSGREYGPSGEGHVRLSFATGLTELAEGLDRLRGVLAGAVR